MASRLSDRLLASGLVPAAGVRAAVARQAVYGGALDTALLELGAIDEETLWDALSAATELGIPDRALCEAPQKLVKPDGSDALSLDAAWSARCRAVPVGLQDGALQILCGEPVARAAIETATGALAIPSTLLVAPEIWIAAVQQAIYGRSMEPRLVRLFARVVGAQPVRRWQAAHLPPPPPVSPEPPVEVPPPRSPPPAPPAAPAARVAPAPAAAPARRPDKAEVPGLIEQLEQGSDTEAAHAALVAISKQDFGPKPKRWAAWWKLHEADDRMDWLFEGLSHKTPEIRAAAEQELRALTGEYFGYAFDLPRREREMARVRWQTWWTERRSRPAG
ncbi:MAG TPA: hypothetical protein VH853_10370 [Polyangia bacterium]|jgi:hypothetical protein|nr:hypothetical protein [Polyangia bacterium]